LRAGILRPSASRSDSNNKCGSLVALAAGVRKLDSMGALSRVRLGSDELPLVDLENEEHICADCKILNFDEILKLSSHAKSRSGFRATTLGYRPDDGKDSSCLLCKLFWTLRVPIIDIKPNMGDRHTYHLRVYSALRHSRDIDYLRLPVECKSLDTSLLAVVPDGMGTSREDNFAIEDHCTRNGYICRAGTEWSSTDLSKFDQSSAVGKTPGSVFVGAFVPPQLDYDLFRLWIHNCVKHHKECNSWSVSSSGFPTRLVDCENLSVVSGSSLPGQYAALSYVWGQEKSTSNDCKDLEDFFLDMGIWDKEGGTAPAGTTHRIKSNSIPRLLRDAIKLTTALRIKYLWVDQLCIDQNDKSALHDEIEKMDIIYRQAFVTIIVAAGNGSDEGIPGVGDLHRDYQPRATVNGIALVSTLCHPSIDITESTWCKRAWTYQEAFFPKRRIILTQKQAYFECRTMHDSEALRKSATLWRRERPSNWLRSGQFSQTQICVPFGFSPLTKRYHVVHTHYSAPVGSTYSDYVVVACLDHIQEYTSRQMSYESDSLNALSGLLNMFTNANKRFQHIWGIPFEICKQGDRVHYGNTLTQQTHQSFVASMLWVHENNSKYFQVGHNRRTHFPSWSWSGWEGTVTWLTRLPRKDYLKMDFRSFIRINVKSESGPGETSVSNYVGIHEADTSLFRDSNACRGLWFSAPYLRLTKLNIESDGSYELKFHHPHKLFDNKTSDVARVYLSISAESAMNLFAQNNLGCLLIACIDFKRSKHMTRYFVLLVSTAVDKLERVGLLQLDTDYGSLENDDHRTVTIY